MKAFNWSQFSSFFSADWTRSFLNKNYEIQNMGDPKQMAYENCYPFMYYLDHGKIYFEQAKNSPMILQPILLYYGLIHLVKACILTVDPYYPETTSVLAHGISTRKRKKQQYLFFHDEVKIQKTGLFPFMSEKLFDLKFLEGDKVSMGELLKQIPELSSLFYQLEGVHTFLPVKQIGDEYFIPVEVIDSFHMTEERFSKFLSDKMENGAVFQRIEDSSLVFQIKGKRIKPPIKYDMHNETFAFSLTMGTPFLYDELLVHFLLLYNLSMIARYETEWWAELTRIMPNQDFPFIQSFMDISSIKGPYLVYQYLLKKIIP